MDGWRPTSERVTFLLFFSEAAAKAPASRPTANGRPTDRPTRIRITKLTCPSLSDPSDVFRDLTWKAGRKDRPTDRLVEGVRTFRSMSTHRASATPIHRCLAQSALLPRRSLSPCHALCGGGVRETGPPDVLDICVSTECNDVDPCDGEPAIWKPVDNYGLLVEHWPATQD